MSGHISGDRLRTLEGIVEGHARRDAKLFVQEFSEPLDPSATDWDAVAWQDVAGEIDANDPTDEELEHLWPYYQSCLVRETTRLASYAEYACKFHSRMDYEADRLVRELCLGAVPASIVDENGWFDWTKAEEAVFPIEDAEGAIAWLADRGCSDARERVESETSHGPDDGEI